MYLSVCLLLATRGTPRLYLSCTKGLRCIDVPKCISVETGRAPCQKGETLEMTLPVNFTLFGAAKTSSQAKRNLKIVFEGDAQRQVVTHTSVVAIALVSTSGAEAQVFGIRFQ